jgi:hypothetical protein
MIENTDNLKMAHDLYGWETTEDAPKLAHDCRKGYTVQELIDALSLVKDKSKFVACPQIGFGGIEGVRSIQEHTVGGYAGQYSYQKTDLVVLK